MTSPIGQRLRDIIAKRTMDARYALIRLLAPSVSEKLETMDSIIKNIPVRPSTLFAKVYFGSTPITAVEIGVAKGENALNILTELNIKKIFLIDPYCSYVQNGRLVCKEDDLKNVQTKILSNYPQAVLIRKYSHDAVTDINAHLDFVYIDGNHDYPFVKRDLELYFPLVREGGLIAGHDYTASFRGIIKATNEFAKEKEIRLYYSPPDWWFFKPKSA